MTRPMMNVESAIELLKARHQKEIEALEAKTAAITTRNGAYTKKADKKEAKQSKEVVKRTGPAIFGLTFPAAKTIDCKQFIIAVRDAGKRPFKAMNALGNEIIVIKVDHSKVRDDVICAIAGYIGYDSTGNFGAQELAARTQAAKELGYQKQPIRGSSGTITTRTEDRQKNAVGVAHQPSGQNDHNIKHMAELKGQESALVEAIIPAERLVDNSFRLMNNPALTPSEQNEVKTIHLDQVAELTILRAKLTQVQEDIRIQIRTEETFQR